MDAKKSIRHIELNGDYIFFDFINRTQPFNMFALEDIEAIQFNGKQIEISVGDYTNLYDATQEDYNALKNVITQADGFIPCGHNTIFNLNHVMHFSKGTTKNSILVNSRNGYFKIELNNLNEATPLVSALLQKWKKIFTEWDQNRDSSMGADDFIK